MILVTPKQEVERKSEWFCGVNFFNSNFKVEWENSVWTKIRFLASGFLFRCGILTLIFLFLIAASSIPGGYYSAPDFFTSSNGFFCRLTLTSWNWLFQWLISLKKMTSELTYGTLNFMNIYLLKVNSVHLSSAKHICPNSWLLKSWVFDFDC